MKNGKILVALAIIGGSLLTENSFSATIFADDFQGDLSQWNSNTSGIIVSDPKNVGERALAFTSGGSGGDLFSASYIDPTDGSFVLSYDYLGLTIDGVTGGGYVGINHNLDETWLAGDNVNYPTLVTNPDTNNWEHVSISFISFSPIQLKLEQFFIQSSTPGTALFKNLVLTDANGATTVPVPGTIWLMFTSLMTFLGINRKKTYV